MSCEDDIVGVQTYTRERVDSSGRIGAPEGSALTQTGWEVYPEALAVRRAAAVTGRPVWVTENGIATDDDELRIDCTRRALQGVEECIRDDVDVQAYFHWSLLDNFEWTLGYPANFGLVVLTVRRSNCDLSRACTGTATGCGPTSVDRD